eukprot:TRINITY_DN3236_c1_g8_i1.p1 TRINITY_DN3236_c1_g8~~TRINITY_DN3236_c1_g8_i1.p1  ORF type:complete len:581 (+),score=117.94 TRINITY_DN3236_c1_g8_i1:51-1793(+)
MNIKPSLYNIEKKMFQPLIEEYEIFFNYVISATDSIKTDLSSLLYPIFIRICYDYMNEIYKTEEDRVVFYNFFKNKHVYFLKNHKEEIVAFINQFTTGRIDNTNSLYPLCIETNENDLIFESQFEISEYAKKCIDAFCREHKLGFLRNLIFCYEQSIARDSKALIRTEPFRNKNNPNMNYKYQDMITTEHLPFQKKEPYVKKESNPIGLPWFDPLFLAEYKRFYDTSPFLKGLNEDSSTDFSELINALTIRVTCLPSYITVQTVDTFGLNALSGTYRGVCKWYNMASKTVKDLCGHIGPITAVAFSVDGQYAVTAGYDCKILMWRFDRNEIVPVREIVAEAPVLSVDFTIDNRLLVCGCSNCKVYLYPLQSTHKVALKPIILNTLFTVPEVVRAHPSSRQYDNTVYRYLFVATSANTIKCYKLALGSKSDGSIVQSFVLPENVGVITSMEIAPNGLILAVGTSFGYMIIFNLETKEIDFNLQIFDKHHVTSISFNSLTNVIALGSTNSLVKSFKIVTGKKNSFEFLSQFPTKNLTITCLKFLANDTLGIVGKSYNVDELENDTQQFRFVNNDNDTIDIEQ